MIKLISYVIIGIIDLVLGIMSSVFKLMVILAIILLIGAAIFGYIVVTEPDWIYNYATEKCIEYLDNYDHSKAEYKDGMLGLIPYQNNPRWAFICMDELGISRIR